MTREILLAGILFLSFTAASAAETETDAFTIVPDFVEQLHADLSVAVTRPFERFDDFFADQRLNEEKQRSRLDTAIGIRYDRYADARLLTDVRLRVALPHLEDRLQLFLDDTFSVETPASQSEILTAAENSTPDLGIRYFFPKTGRWTLRGDLGGRLGSHPQGLVRLRLSRVVAVGSWDCYLSQSLFWLTRDHLGESSEVRWHRSLSDDRLFRALTRLSWSETEPGVTPFHSFDLFGTPAPRWGYRLGISGSFPAVPHTTEALYSLSSSLRYRLHSSWLFLEGGGGIEFPQSHGYNPNPFVMLRMEAIFQ